MLTVVPLDSVRSIFEFLDLESLFKCRRLCKYMKYIIDHDFVIHKYEQQLIKTELTAEQAIQLMRNQIAEKKKEVEKLDKLEKTLEGMERKLILNELQKLPTKAEEFLEAVAKVYELNNAFKRDHGKNALDEKDLNIIKALPLAIAGGYVMGSIWKDVYPIIKKCFPQLFEESSDPQNQKS
ncbi:MAG: F-box protein [Nitrososphaerota archaeon]